MEDKQILSLLLSKDEQGIKELAAKYGTKLKHLAMGILPEEDALECVNDTYLAVWNSIPPKKPHCSSEAVWHMPQNTASSAPIRAGKADIGWISLPAG